MIVYGFFHGSHAALSSCTLFFSFFEILIGCFPLLRPPFFQLFCSLRIGLCLFLQMVVGCFCTLILFLTLLRQLFCGGRVCPGSLHKILIALYRFPALVSPYLCQFSGGFRVGFRTFDKVGIRILRLEKDQITGRRFGTVLADGIVDAVLVGVLFENPYPPSGKRSYRSRPRGRKRPGRSDRFCLPA